jgi:hypothetical protein
METGRRAQHDMIDALVSRNWAGTGRPPTLDTGQWERLYAYLEEDE